LDCELPKVCSISSSEVSQAGWVAKIGGVNGVDVSRGGVHVIVLSCTPGFFVVVSGANGLGCAKEPCVSSVVSFDPSLPLSDAVASACCGKSCPGVVPVMTVLVGCAVVLVRTLGAVPGVMPWWIGCCVRSIGLGLFVSKEGGVSVVVCCPRVSCGWCCASEGGCNSVMVVVTVEVWVVIGGCVLSSLSDEPDCGNGIFFFVRFFDVGFFHDCCRLSTCALVRAGMAGVGAL